MKNKFYVSVVREAWVPMLLLHGREWRCNKVISWRIRFREAAVVEYKDLQISLTVN